MADEPILKHYRYGGKLTHCGIEILPNGKDINVVIERIVWSENEVINGEKKPTFVAYFRQNSYSTLPMVLNATNKKRLARLAGTPYLETVKNLPITLTQEMDKAIGGGRDMALRISQIAPKVTAQGAVIKNKLTPDSSNWASAVAWAQIEGNKIEAVWAKYDVTPEDQVKFKEALEVKE